MNPPKINTKNVGNRINRFSFIEITNDDINVINNMTA